MRVGLAGLSWGDWRRNIDESGSSRGCIEWSVLVGRVSEGEESEREMRFGIDGRKERSASGLGDENGTSDLCSIGGIATNNDVCLESAGRHYCAVER
jgi:hypothetical protein